MESNPSFAAKKQDRLKFTDSLKTILSFILNGSNEATAMYSAMVNKNCARTKTEVDASINKTFAKQVRSMDKVGRRFPISEAIYIQAWISRTNAKPSVYEYNEMLTRKTIQNHSKS